MGCCSIRTLEMKRFLCSDEEGEDHFEHLDKYTGTPQDCSTQQLKSNQTTKYLGPQTQSGYKIDWNTISSTNIASSRNITTDLQSDITAMSTLITRSLPEEMGIFRSRKMSEERESNSNSSSMEDTYTTDTTSSCLTIKRRKKTKAERKARRVNPAVYVPSPKPRFVICKGW